MIGMKLIGALIGRKAKEKAVDAVLDKVDLPAPMENVIKAAVTGNPAGLVGGIAKAATKRSKKGADK